MIISERIFKILEQRGISQSAFGKMVGLSGSTISDWKTKKTNPSADKIMTICDALDITPEQLLTGKGIDGDFDEYSSRELDFSFHDKEIILEYHKLSIDQQKRFERYLKTLKKLDDLEKM
ncbi:HTH domain-containing protein [Butyrivibrio proteoclasticus B316]|uniref:HTH domain-containing protein n=1 Tax=Butyrivibrio proteoclasticus (strain ATCC 51982 / DSM 14932 / B316) TaxID=515622 RepID=E0S071_BUTPB|nr:helix-turn-helix transcriptional regulator [Butyrivibrio proteoclasticus]ADL35558.1 HTH domain-containing protein [Butyrivibrio proteoclasticus B316]